MQTVNLQRVYDFMSELSVNNNKPWFDAHKNDYLLAMDDFKVFAYSIIQGLAKFDSGVAGLEYKDCTYRIYRDLRFSLDKTPYKTHLGLYVCPGGKKACNAGYYIHIEPLQQNFLCSGIHMPTPQSLKSIREEIMLNGAEFNAAIQACKGFEIDWSNALKRIPNGFNANDEFAEYYKLRDFDLIQPVSKEQLLANDFVDFALIELKKTFSLNQILYKCVDYAKENF